MFQQLSEQSVLKPVCNKAQVLRFWGEEGSLEKEANITLKNIWSLGESLEQARALWCWQLYIPVG